MEPNQFVNERSEPQRSLPPSWRPLHGRRVRGGEPARLAGGVAFTPGQYAKVMALLGAGSQVGTSLPWGRAQESEADHIGLVYMARAGYDPHAAVAFWNRMQRAGTKQPPELLSDHPSHAHRVRQIEGWMPEAERQYRPAAA